MVFFCALKFVGFKSRANLLNESGNYNKLTRFHLSDPHFNDSTTSRRGPRIGGIFGSHDLKAAETKHHGAKRLSEVKHVQKINMTFF